MKKIFMLFVSLMIFYSDIFSQWTSVTALNTSIRDTAGATVPLMASSQNGYTYVSWFEQGIAGYELRMQLLDSAGYKMWGNGGIVVSNYPQNPALFRYDLKADKDGNAIVAFQDERNTNLHIVVYKIDINGNSLWGSSGISLIDTASDQGLAPTIGITNQNAVVVAWTASFASQKWVAAQRISASGIVQWNDVYRIKDSGAVLKYSRPEVLPFGIDNVQILYAEESGAFPGVTSTLYTKKIDALGNDLLSNPIQISTKTISYNFFPEPVMDINDGFFLAFTTTNPVNSSLNDVYVQHIDSAGNLWSPAGIPASNSSTEHKLFASSCLDSNNELWTLLNVQDHSQTNSGVSVQKFDANGNQLLGSNALNIIPLNANFYMPQTISDAVDGVIFSCSYGIFYNFFAQKLDYAGNSMWPGVSRNLTDFNSDKDDFLTGKYINHNLVFVWKDYRNGSGIFAQNIHGDGSLGVITGMDKSNALSNIKFFPNPSNAPQLFFGSVWNTEKIITITNAYGKIISHFNVSQNELSVSLNQFSSLPYGIYFVSVKSTSGVNCFKWIKQ